MSKCFAIKKDGVECGRILKDGKCQFKTHNNISNVDFIQKKSEIPNIASEETPDMSPTASISDCQTDTHTYYSGDFTPEQKIIKINLLEDEDEDKTPIIKDQNNQLTNYCSNHSIKITRRMQNDDKEYIVVNAHMLIRVSVDSKMLFMWTINAIQTIALVEYINSIGLEAHEIILIDHCRMFMDIDIVLSSKQYKIQLNKFKSEDYLTGAIIDAYEQACKLSIQAHGYSKELRYNSATRIRPIDGDQIKIGIHIIVDAWMPISYAKYIANDMRKQFKCINTDLPEKMLIDGIDTAPYRMRGSLSLPGGVKNGVKLKWSSSMGISDFFISRNDQDTPVLNKLDIKLKEYQPHEINNDFIKEALQYVESIPDWSDAFDLDCSSLRGNNMIVKRVRPSHCSVCDRTHDAYDSLRLIFNHNTAFWKCARAPDGTKANVWYENKEAKKKSNKLTIMTDKFDEVFASKRITDDLKLLLSDMGRTWDEFKEAMCDESFEDNELSYWADKYCHVRNHATNNFSLSYVHFEKLLKQIVFQAGLHYRFVCYFIHEFFLFGMRSSNCWVRAKVTEHNTVPLQPYQISEFKSVSIKYIVLGADDTPLIRSTELFNLFKSLPYHKFANQCHLWNHDPLDLETFSAALPFQYTDLDRIVEESELPELLMYYLKDVLCNNDEDAWEWLRSYLANVIHQPDCRTEVMLVLYSQEKRLGKSTLKWIIDHICGEGSNVMKVERLSDVFGERGGTTVVGKRVVWFEELTDNKSVFRANMDRMKTTITDKRTTYKPLYHELHETNNTNEYMACTNHLVGVLEDRQTFLHVTDKHKDDHVFYSKLRNNLDQHGCNLFATYLKPFTTQLPMKCYKTAIYRSMLSNGAEAIEIFINELKSGKCAIELTKSDKFLHCTQDLLYAQKYQKWCENNHEKVISFTHFKEKLSHYDRRCEYKQIRVRAGRIYAFVFPVDWVVLPTNDD